MDAATQALNKLDEAAGESWLTWEDQPAASPTARIPAEPSSRQRESPAHLQPAQQPAARKQEQWSAFGFDDSASESASTGALPASQQATAGAVDVLMSAAVACNWSMQLTALPRREQGSHA